MKIWNEIVQAYEEQMAVLEAARDEYDRACKAIIEEVYSKAREQTSEWSIPKYMRIEVAMTEDGGAGQYEVALKLREDSNEVKVTRVRLAVWVASAYDGPARKLNVGVVVRDRSEDALSSTQALRQQVKEQFAAGAAPPGEDVDESVAVHHSLDIDDDVASKAMARLKAYVDDLVSIIEEWREKDAPLRALMNARRILLETPLDRKQDISPKKQGLNHDGTLHYVWLKKPEPSVWIGYDTANQGLFLIHDEVEDQTLTKRVASKIGGKVTTRGRYPAVLLSPKKPSRDKEQNQQALVDMILEAFRQYHELAH